jgi:predicted outer membrane repeat protein
LTTALPDVASNITITGPSSAQLTVRRSTGNTYRIFNITSGTVGLSGMTVREGLTAAATFGGGISNGAILTLSDVVVTANQAGGDGGGIANAGTLTTTNCVISGNTAGNSGGGISTTGPITLTTTTISNNTAANEGGALSNGSNAVIVNSTISGNTVPAPGVVGAITNAANLVMTNSTVSGNHVTVAIENTNAGSLMRLTNCTITANDGNGINNCGCNGPTSTVRNSIIAGNGANDVSGNWTSFGHNFIGQTRLSSGFTNGVNGDTVGDFGSPLNAQLGPLANNGGPTQTHALLSNSPAIDAGDNCVTQATHCSDANLSTFTTDQRGFSRMVDGPDADAIATVDIGAYETQSPLANLSDTTTNEDTQLQIAFDGGDPSTITSITATSSNSTLVPNDAAHLSAALFGATGVVTINPATNEKGTTNITVTINRTGGPESKTFLLTVNPVNDAPSFTKGADQTINEDAGAQVVNNWATSISPGPADEAGQTVNFNITGNTNAALFSVAPAVSSSGTLTYTPAADANGSATITINLMDNGGTANGGVDTSASQMFVINVTAVNDPPSFTQGANQIVNEDSGAQTVVNWATAISRGPADESGQTVSFTVSNDNNALFSTQPAISPAGTLTYQPAANANGATTVIVSLKDNGGTANGGIDTSTLQTFSINVLSVNDAPSFTKGANQTVNEDAAAQTVNNWATAISPGPADESGQTLTFQVTNNTNTSLFSAGPTISSTGTLTYTPAADANGSATITINLKDSGGTANGGVDTSASQNFTITVNSVNDAPSFTKGADQTVNNAGAQTVANWATNISAGPANESGQTLTFQVTGNTNPSLFTAGPAVSSTGTLTYTLSASGGGTGTIAIKLKDNGGTANGGVDTSASQSFTITVNPIGGFFKFVSGTGDTQENFGSMSVPVLRTGDTSRAATVDYATNPDNGLPCSNVSGVASPKCDFTAAIGTLSFAAGETSKTITILISQDSFIEIPEDITLTLSNPTGGAALATPSQTAITIHDDDTQPSGNAIDDAGNFVRMHYHDFLNREADQSGLDFWTNQITSCGGDAACTEVRRINVSAAFFLSIEFQQTGYLVERMYKTAYADAIGTSSLNGSHQIFVPVVRFNEFLQDTQRIGRGVVVLAPGWEQALENNKQAYALEFVQTSRFTAAGAFPTTMTPTQFVDKLNQNAGNVLSPSERTTAINLFGISADTTNVSARAQAVRQVAEDQDLFNAEFNRAFVLTEFFGYLRRNPNDLPDSDYTGYEFWLSKLNQFNGNYIGAEMVKAFIASSEYRQRFGP